MYHCVVSFRKLVQRFNFSDLPQLHLQYMVTIVRATLDQSY